MHDGSWIVLVILIPLGGFISGIMLYLYISQFKGLMKEFSYYRDERNYRIGMALFIMGTPLAFIAFTLMWVYPCYLAIINGALN